MLTPSVEATIATARHDMAAFNRQEYELDHHQVGSELEAYGRLLSAENRMLSARDHLEGVEERLRKLRWKWGRSKRYAKARLIEHRDKFEAQIRHLADRVVEMRGALCRKGVDLRDPETVERLKEGLYEARVHRKLMVDMLGHGRPSSSFWDSMRKLPRQQRRGILSALRPRVIGTSENGEPRIESQVQALARVRAAALDWLQQDKVGSVDFGSEPVMLEGKATEAIECR